MVDFLGRTDLESVNLTTVSNLAKDASQTGHPTPSKLTTDGRLCVIAPAIPAGHHYDVRRRGISN